MNAPAGESVEYKKLLYIKNFGCQMNAHDAQRMEEVLRPYGYEPTSSPASASVILLNTCTVREGTQQKILSALGNYARFKEARPEVVIGVAGCVAQQEGSRLLQAIPFLDLVLGPDHIAELPRILEEARHERQVRVGFAEVEGYSFLRAAPRPGLEGPTALVTIQKGCDNHCSYCIVPLVRGPEVSRPAAEVLAEVRDLVAAGVREVTLIGQNVNSYRGYTGSDRDFAVLLGEVSRVPGLLRLRFTTSHPRDFGESLCQCYAALPTLCPWLHLPVQSGSTSVLARMNRGYTREDYLGIVRRVRGARPEVAIGTDLIVGFPGETETEFQETLSLVEEVQYDYAYSFMYSVRPGTPAERLCDDVPGEEKARRLHLLQALQDRISRNRLASWEGRVVPVLVEGPSRKGLPQLCGRTPGNQVVNFDSTEGEPLTGSVVMVRVIRAGSHSLVGSAMLEEARC